ncbi:MAG: PQQ-binding-like beta-propeller repeat protein, partial [Ktedonobacteraceae bacterium]
PNLSQVIDTYTPTNYNELNQQDEDLGSASPVMLPKQEMSNTPYMAVQAGKDEKVRLLNRQNLSGQGGPNHVGDELQSVDLPQGCGVLTQPVAWNEANGITWVFVTNGCGLSAFKVSTDTSGHTSLQVVYTNQDSGSSPFIANGVLFVQDNQVLRALNPSTGVTLWSSNSPSAGGPIGSLHWESPIVVNGVVYVPDDDGALTAYNLART